MDTQELPWNFEAFRKFITFKAAQNAASIISLFDGENLVNDAKKLSEFQKLLSKRSGLVWEPVRQNSKDVMFSSEGNVFRNKARVLSSLYLLNPFALKTEGKIEATKFSKLLASGKINEKQFFEFIITHYEYPHAAYDENWAAWTKMGLKLKPFVFILQILIELFDKDQDQAYLTVDEFARFAHSNPRHEKVKSIANEILEFRRDSSKSPSRKRSDKIDRKINDIFGFLCISGLTYYDGSRIRLNLIGRDPEEGAFFYLSRNGANIVEALRKLLEGS